MLPLSDLPGKALPLCHRRLLPFPVWLYDTTKQVSHGRSERPDTPTPGATHGIGRRRSVEIRADGFGHRVEPVPIEECE